MITDYSVKNAYWKMINEADAAPATTTPVTDKVAPVKFFCYTFKGTNSEGHPFTKAIKIIATGTPTVTMQSYNGDEEASNAVAAANK